MWVLGVYQLLSCLSLYLHREENEVEEEQFRDEINYLIEEEEEKKEKEKEQKEKELRLVNTRARTRLKSSKESMLSPMVKCDQESEEGDDDIEVIGRNSHDSPILLNATVNKKEKNNTVCYGFQQFKNCLLG